MKHEWNPQLSSNHVGRRDFLKTAGAGLACTAHHVLADASSCTGKKPQSQPPNILFIFSDQQRWDTVGCYGEPLFDNLTANLDRLARQGVRFQHAFTCQPVCGPARSCLQTGKYATETGCFRNGIALPQTEKTLAHWFSQNGYQVGYIGKWHLASTHSIPGRDDENFMAKPVPLERRGGYCDFWLASDVLEFTSHSYDGCMFDAEGNPRKFPPDRYRADVLTDWTLEYLTQHKNDDQPFFLFLSYIEPHHQNDHKHFEGPHGSKERFASYRVPKDLAGKEGDWREELPDYLGCCWSLDQNVGRIVSHLDSLGLSDNTLIVYTSDHGCHFRTRNSEYKRSCHDNSIRIPMIIRGPGFTGGKVVPQLVSLIDLPPTLLTAGDITPPDSLRGRPIQKLLSGSLSDWPNEVFIQISESQVGRAIRTADWKYCVCATDKDGVNVINCDEYQESELYNLKNDPCENNNLVKDPALADIRVQLAKILKQRMAAAGETELRITGAI